MNSTASDAFESRTNNRIMIPLSMAGALIAVAIACLILALVIFIKRLHTMTHLMICNASMASIYYCVVQCVNYVFLTLITWHDDDQSCRWRGYFGYMTVIAVIYSYLAQAISRFFLAVLANRYRWATSAKTHVSLIVLQWIVVVLLPMPALLTEDIYHRPHALCWVPKENTAHVLYTLLAYYLLPAIFIVVIYVAIYCRVKRRTNSVCIRRPPGRATRDLEVLYNIMILFAIYIVGAIPIILYLFTGVILFYEIGIIFVSFTVAVEKLATIMLDRHMRNLIRGYFRPSQTQVRPIS